MRIISNNNRNNNIIIKLGAFLALLSNSNINSKSMHHFYLDEYTIYQTDFIISIANEQQQHQLILLNNDN